LGTAALDFNKLTDVRFLLVFCQTNRIYLVISKMSSTNAVAATSATISASPVHAVLTSPIKVGNDNNNSSSDTLAKLARSRFSNNSFKPLFNPRNKIYNKPTPFIFSPIISKDLADKTKSMRVTGSSKGPGPFTTTRKEIVGAQKEAKIVLPVLPAFKHNKAFDTYQSHTVHHREGRALEAKARAIQANISELYAQKELLVQGIEKLKDERADVLAVSKGQVNHCLAKKANEGGIAGSS
jgi:hypothetical protein